MLSAMKIGHMVLADTSSIFLSQDRSQLTGKSGLSGAVNGECLVLCGTGRAVMEQGSAWPGASSFKNDQENVLVTLSG